MAIIYLLIALSLCTGMLFLGSFFWAYKNGQFDDTTTPGMRILDPTDNQNTNNNL